MASPSSVPPEVALQLAPAHLSLTSFSSALTTNLCTAMDAFFTISSPVPAPAPEVTDVLVDREDTGSSSDHSTCTIA